MIESQPTSFQMPLIQIKVRKALDEVIGAMLLTPSAERIWLTVPVEPKMFISIPASTTHEIKCGKVTMVCTVFFAHLSRSSLSAIASRTAHGIWNAMRPRLKIMVFLTARKNSGSLNIFVKFARPIHSLPQSPPL